MSNENPYQALVSAAADQAFTKMMQAAELSGDAQVQAFAEAQRLNKIAEALNKPSLMWREGRLTDAVKQLEVIVQSETARQSDIFGRLKSELVRLGGNPGGATASSPATGSASGATATTGSNVSNPPVNVSSSDINPRKRETSLELLHPAIRQKVRDLIGDLAANSVPMKVFETFRTPERQAYLFAQGRTRDLDKGKVTNADAWESYHQYGVAVDMVIDHPNYGMWDTASATTRGWWDKYHELAEKHGLEPLSFEKPHVQLVDIKTSQLLSGEEPGPGDDSWYDNFSQAVARWQGDKKPPLPSDTDRPAIADMAAQAGHAVSGIDWSALPAVAEVDWMSMFGGREWRVDGNGVYLRHDEENPQRTPGTPTTVLAALDLYAEHIGAACQKFSVPPELVLMTVATETAQMRNHDFTGPKTFRWEQHVTLTTTGDPAIDGSEKGDYSAGPMQVLSNTARDINNRLGLGFTNDSDLKWFKNKPNASGQRDLGLYKGEISIPLGTGYLSLQRGQTQLNPVLASAAYNAGSIRTSGTNSWHIRSHGDHLDRAIKWFGDGCAALKDFGR